MYGRRSATQKIGEDLHPVRSELFLRNRIDAVARLRSRFAVGENVFAKHLIALKSDDELDAATEIDTPVEAVTTDASRFFGALHELVRRDLASSAIEFGLNGRFECDPVRRCPAGVEREIEKSDFRDAEGIAFRHQVVARNAHANQIQIFDRERRDLLHEFRSRRTRLLCRHRAVEETTEWRIFEDVGRESERATRRVALLGQSELIEACAYVRVAVGGLLQGSNAAGIGEVRRIDDRSESVETVEIKLLEPRPTLIH